MSQHRNLDYGQRLPEAVVDALQELVSTYASPNFQLTQLNATTIQVIAGIDNDQVCIGIAAKWRYNRATVQAAHPGGVAGSYDVYVTGSANNFAAGDPEVDNTDYTFGLQIRALSSPPSTAIWRKVGQVVWSGSAITGIIPLIGGAAGGSFGGAAGFIGEERDTAKPITGTGTVEPYPGWLYCNGAAVSRSQYATLFAEIGVTYGAGNGSTTFNLPDRRGRFVAYPTDGASSAPRVTGAVAGASGGAEAVGLTVPQLPAHNHGGGVHTHSHSLAMAPHSHTLKGGGSTNAPGNYGAVMTSPLGNGSLPATSVVSTGLSGAISDSNAMIASDGAGELHPNIPPVTYAGGRCIRYV